MARVRLKGAPPDPAARESAVQAWLRFIEQDARANPARLVPLVEPEAAALERLVAGVVVDDTDVLPDDVTF